MVLNSRSLFQLVRGELLHRSVLRRSVLGRSVHLACRRVRVPFAVGHPAPR